MNHNTIYIGGYETDSVLNRSFPRLFKSTNGGETFNDISAGLIDSTSNYSVEVIAVHPKFPHIILCAGKGSYLYRSVDTGYSWTKNRAPQGFYSLAMNPFLPGIVYAGESTFWKSSDTGRTWAYCTTGLVKGFFRKVAIHPVTPEIVYTINQYGFFKTTNSGLTWAESDTNVSATVILDMVFAPSMHGILYAATKYSGFFRSTNNGGTWERRMMPYLCQSFSGCAIHPTDPNTLIAAGKYG